MKTDKMMTEGYNAVRDKSNDRYASSEDEMNFNENQARVCAGQDFVYRSDNIRYVNPTQHSNISLSPSDGGSKGD